MSVLESSLSALGRASFTVGIFALAVWLLLAGLDRLSTRLPRVRLFRVPPALRAFVWWVVAARFVVALLPATSLPISTPFSLSDAWMPSLSTLVESFDLRERRETPDAVIAAADSTATFERSSPPLNEHLSSGRSTGLSIAWAALALLWAAGLAAFVRRDGHDLAALRRRLTSARDISDPRVLSAFERAIDALGLTTRPRLVVSSEIHSPQVTGLFRPTILVPARALERLDREHLEMILGHELAHVRRRDLWLDLLPALAERLFFFHPLVRLAVREYALAREAACDALVLSTLHPAARDYARLLLDWGVLRRTPLVAAAASPTFRTLKRRLEMLETPAASTPKRPRSSRVLAIFAVVGATIAIIPFRFVAAEAETRPGRLQPLPALSHAANSDLAHKEQARNEDRSSYVMTTNSDGDSYVIVQGDEATMNGNWSALGRAKKLAKNGEPIFYAEVDGEEWQIRDRSTIAAAQALFAEQSRIGEEQGKLGEKQGKLGDQQGQLGDQQAELGDRQGEIGDEIAQLEIHRETGLAVSDYERKLAQLSREMERLSSEQERLGELQEGLGRQQEALGKQQEELGKLQEKESMRVEKEIAELVRRAIDQGIAQRIDD